MYLEVEFIKTKTKTFFENKTVDQHFGANLKKRVFAKFCCKFLAFLRFFAQKMLKMTISTSVWSAQHPNAGQNLQQPPLPRSLDLGCPLYSSGRVPPSTLFWRYGKRPFRRSCFNSLNQPEKFGILVFNRFNISALLFRCYGPALTWGRFHKLVCALHHTVCALPQTLRSFLVA